MTVTVETIITCDAALNGCWGTYCDSDSRHEPAKSQRMSFTLNGWHHHKGKDYCGNCWLILAATEGKS